MPGAEVTRHQRGGGRGRVVGIPMEAYIHLIPNFQNRPSSLIFYHSTIEEKAVKEKMHHLIMWNYV